MEYQAEILCLGNELLIGRTINTNGSFIAKHLSQLGFKVNRITTLRDEEDLGIETIRTILDRKPQVLCITGGLGPTHDDIQLTILSKAINRKLIRNETAYEMIRKRYSEMNAVREKMADLPDGSQPLKNSQGSAPGVLTEVNGTIIFSLPGVPREMKAIFTEEIVPYLNRHYEFDEITYEFGVDIRGAPESAITDLTDEIMKDYPEISFKSHPKKNETGFYLSLHTYAIATDSVQVEEALRKWVELIEKNHSIQYMSDIRSVM